jgi:hypothetical protein
LRPFLLLAVLSFPALAQSPSPGLRLHGRNGSNSIQLVDNTGATVHTWSNSLPSLGAVRILADGTLLRDVVVGGSGIPLPGVTGGVHRVALDGTILWDYRHSGPTFSSHHDLEPLPNGNVLLIVWEKKTAAAAFAAGREPALSTNAFFYPDAVVEVQPTGPTSGTVVWEWHGWDHMVQDFDPLAANYGSVAAHPELLDLNFPRVLLTSGDWTHMNGIDYDPVHDWIVLSSRERCEILIIDHGTTTAEAAGHSGGRWGKGGDILYRWGNPAAYRAGSAADQRLGFQHCPRFIPAGYPGAGNLTVFNNVYQTDRSAVFEIQLPLDPSGNFILGANGRYGPDAPVWSFSAASFYSPFISSAERLPNGNTLVCSGGQGNLFEVTASGQVAWTWSSGMTNIFQASYVERTLWAEGSDVSASLGGSVGFDLLAGSAHAGDMHLMLGTLSGTSPGIAIGNVTLPLNLDAFLMFTGSSPNVTPFHQTLGLLGPTGRTSASFSATPGLLPPALIGLRMDFAFLLVDLATASVAGASNPVPMAIRP